MKYRLGTETGSIYLIDTTNKTWERAKNPTKNGPFPLRTLDGSYNKINPIQLGQPLKLICNSLNPNMDYRLIQTSHIISKEEFK